MNCDHCAAEVNRRVFCSDKCRMRFNRARIKAKKRQALKDVRIPSLDIRLIVKGECKRHRLKDCLICKRIEAILAKTTR